MLLIQHSYVPENYSHGPSANKFMFFCTFFIFWNTIFINVVMCVWVKGPCNNKNKNI